MEELKEALTLSDIYVAKLRIKKFFQASPCAITHFDVDSGIEVVIKEENLSPTGSYYDRAVLNSLLSLPEEQQRRGVITASECRSFIRALFYYGPELGVPVTLVVPCGSEIHRQMWSQPGKIIVSCGKDIKEAKRCAEEFAKGVRLEFIDSDHSPTMLAGLGTLGLEILDQCDCKLEAVVVPNSDKTLLKALRHSIKSIFPHIKIMGAQVKNKELTRVRSFTDIDVSDTSDGVIQVSDADLSRTVIRVLEEKGVLLSKEGVSGLAAVMAGNLTHLTNRRVVVVLSECLVPSLLQLEQLINEGLAARDC